jgi:phenylacetate-CoA ligase
MKIGDLMQKFFMSNPKRAMWFLSTMPASFWEKQGRKKVLRTFHEAAEKVPAYKDFLKDRKVKPEEIKTFEDFQKKVPILDKKSYITRYKLEERCLGKLTEMSTVSASSGSSGIPTFWPRMNRQDLMLPNYFENFYLQNWDIDKKSTLIVVTNALGTWVAGQLIIGATKPIVDKGKYPLTLVTPGADIGQIIKIIKGIGTNYDQIVIIIYPSLLIPILDAGDKENINWKKMNIKLWIGGEPTSKEWHKHIRKRLEINPDDLSFAANVYGTADAGGIGFSSPLSSLIVNLASKDKKLAKELFKNEGLPSLVQFSPLGYFIEGIDGEIILNYMSGIPLIRYCIHDKGGIISYERALEILRNHNYDIENMLIDKGYSKNKIWKWPFLYTFGRKDNVVSIGGANVYPENLEPVLYRKELRRVNIFKLAIETNEEGEMRLVILVELKEGRKATGKNLADLENKCHDIFLNKLLRDNDDYRDASEIDPKSTDPLIKIYNFGNGPFAEDKKRTKRKYIL